MNPRAATRRPFKSGRGRHRTARRGRWTRRRRRLSHRDQQRLGTLLVLLTILVFWWQAGHIPGWFSTPVAWLCLGGTALVTVGRLTARPLARLLHQRRQEAQARRLVALAAVDPLAFEALVGRLFEREGFQVTVTKASGDHGIDLWLWKAGHAPTPVQCKRYRAKKVGEPELQAFSGALRYAGAETGIFVTTSRFTPPAIAWAKQERIRLIDGPALAKWQARVESHHTALERSSDLPC